MTDVGAGLPCWGVGDDASTVFTIALHAAPPGMASRQHDRYTPGLHHFAFHAESRDDVDRFYAFLCAQQLPVLDAPEEYDYTPGYYAVFFADPDGLKLEFVFEPHLLGSH